MPDFTPDDIDIDPNEFLSACNSKEINELIEALIEDGHLQPDQLTESNNSKKLNPQDVTFWESLDYLKKCRDMLSIHEENYINNMAYKYKHLR
jgi:hypothetical protein